MQSEPSSPARGFLWGGKGGQTTPDKPWDTEVLTPDPSHDFSDVLRQRPNDYALKAYAVSYMDRHTHSFEYTRAVLAKLDKQARAEIERLGGNVGLIKFLDRMKIPDPDDTGNVHVSSTKDNIATTRVDGSGSGSGSTARRSDYDGSGSDSA